MNHTQKWASILLVTSALTAQSKTLLFDIQPVGRGDGNSNVSTASHFAAYDPQVALTAPVAVSTILADYTAGITITDEDGLTYSLVQSGTNPGFYNAGNNAWNHVEPILEGYNYNANGMVLTVSGISQLPAGEVITLTVFGVGDNLGQAGTFTPSYGASPLPAQSTFFGTNRLTETGSIRSAQWQFAGDGVTDTISITVSNLAGKALFNGFSITSAPVSYGDITSLTLTPETTTHIVGGPVTQLTAIGDFTVDGLVDVTALNTTYASNDTNIVTVSPTGIVTVVGPGIATVTATKTGDNSSTASDTATFTVEAPTSLAFTVPDPSYLLASGSALDLGVTASSTSLTDVPIEGYTGFYYYSDGNTDADINEDTGVVTPYEAGTETVYAVLPVPGSADATASITIEVEGASSITATVPTNSLFVGGAGVTMTTTVSTANLTDIVINNSDYVDFVTDNSGIATVDALSGDILPGTLQGIANISVTFPDGSGSTIGTSVAITTMPIPAKPTTLLHRYSFSNSAGAATAGDPITDSVGTAHGTVEGLGGTFSGTTLILPGGVEANDTGYVNLPNGILSTIPAVDTAGITLEVWMTHNDTTAWMRAFDFGNNTAGEDMVSTTQTSTIDLIPRRSGTAGNVFTEFTLSRALYGTGPLEGSEALDTGVLAQLVLTLDPETGIRNLYKDGALIGSGPIAFDNNKISLVDDVNCWLGRSNAADQRLNGSFDEFRIYTGIMTESEAAANFGAGPDTIVVPVAYATWSSSYANNEDPDLDFDKDGVSNGVEYFMGETNSPVFTANPGIVAGKVTWPKDSGFTGSYTVQTSPDLVTWTDQASTIVGNSVEYTVTNDPNESFIRLKVTP